MTVQPANRLAYRRAQHHVRLAWLLLILGAGMAAFAVPTAAQPAKHGGPLSARLAALYRAGADVHSATARHALSLPADGPASLVVDQAGKLLVYIQLDMVAADRLAALEQAGAVPVHISNRYSIVTAFIAPRALGALAQAKGIRFVLEALAPAKRHETARSAGPPIVVAGGEEDACTMQRIVSEGDALLRAADARATFGVDGSGIVVGVLSDSYDLETRTEVDAADDIASGDLPGPGNPCGRTTPVRVLAEPRLGPGVDEGRGMLQIVHDLAPGAELAFATAADGLFAYADNIRRMRSETGADVLVDDWYYVDEPLFQDGPINVAIRDVAEDGALYVTAGGNIHLEDALGNPIGSYEAPAYRPTACPALLDPTAGSQLAPGPDCHAFDPLTGGDPQLGITLPPGGRVVVNLQWSEPWFGVRTDFDAYLVDHSNTILAKADTQLGFAPREVFSYDNTGEAEQTVQLVIGRFTGDATPRFKLTFGNAALRAPGPTALEYAGAGSGDIFGPTVTDHSAAAYAVNVGAVSVEQPLVAEPFSSRGPATLYWQAAESIRPAEPLAEPEVRAKPDVMAPNGVRTTFYGRTAFDGERCVPADPAANVCRFFGTSAAAPHVAAVLALMKQRAEAYGVPLNQQWAESVLERSATAMEGTPEARGAGLVDALAAVEYAGSVD